MKPGAKVAVQKLYAKVDRVIEAGTTLTIAVANRYNTYKFNGAKTSEWLSGWLGGCLVCWTVVNCMQ